MKQRLPLLLSATALVVAVLGSTSLGQAAGNAVGQTVQKAKAKAGFASPTVRRGPRGPRGRRGLRGPPGPAGPAGAAGAQGPAGFSALTYLVGPTRSVSPGAVAGDIVVCPSGQYPISGGIHTDSALEVLNDMHAYRSVSGGPIDSWIGFVVNEGTLTHNFNVLVTCAPAATVTGNLSIQAIPDSLAPRKRTE